MRKDFKFGEAALLCNSAINLVGQTIPVLVGLVLTPFLVARLGANRFGLLSLALVLLGYFSILDLGLGRSLTKHVAEALPKKHEAHLAAIVQTAMMIQVAFGLLLAGGLASFSPRLVRGVLSVEPHLVHEAEAAFRVTALCFPIILLSTSLRGVLEAMQRFLLINSVSILAAAAAYLAALVGAVSGLPLDQIIALMLLPQVAVVTAYSAFVWRSFPPLAQKWLFDLSIARSLFGFGRWIMVTNVIWPVLVYLDHFIVGSLVSTAAVTYYAVPHRIVTFLDRVPASIVPALFTALSMLGFSRLDQSQKLHQTGLKLVVAVVGPLILGLIVFGDRVLSLVLGAEFNDAAVAPLKILALGALATSMLQMPFTLLQTLGRPDFIAKFYLLQLLVYPPFLYGLTLHMGLVGAATASAIRQLILLVVLSSACKRFFQIPLLAGRGTVELLVGTVMALSLSVGFASALGRTLTASVGMLILGSALLYLYFVGSTPQERKGP